MPAAPGEPGYGGGMATPARSVSDSQALGSHAVASRRPYAPWRLVRDTVATCFRYRVTGLAAEAGFFALLSLPPLVLGLFGTLGYFPGLIGSANVSGVRDEIIRLAGEALTPKIVQDTIAPTVDDVLGRARPDIVSLGFLLSLWSGSRAVNVFVDTISIMYGLGGRRGIVRQRAMSFGLYVLGLILGAVFVPLVIAGPGLVRAVLPAEVDHLVDLLYWPVVVLLAVPSLAVLYHVSIPVRTRWRRALPGAALALLLWVLFSYLLRWVIAASVDGTSIYGPLSTPIVVMIWLYGLAIAVLIGAALNAAADRIWPIRAVQEARRTEALRRAAEAEAEAAAVGLKRGGLPPSVTIELPEASSLTPVRPRS